jgi:V8-like Glu-specific endopeptidase
MIFNNKTLAYLILLCVFINKTSAASPKINSLPINTDISRLAQYTVGYRIQKNAVNYSCTGVAIGESLILTAAHCLSDESGYFHQYKKLELYTTTKVINNLPIENIYFPDLLKNQHYPGSDIQYVNRGADFAIIHLGGVDPKVFANPLGYLTINTHTSLVTLQPFNYNSGYAMTSLISYFIFNPNHTFYFLEWQPGLGESGFYYNHQIESTSISYKLMESSTKHMEINPKGDDWVATYHKPPTIIKKISGLPYWQEESNVKQQQSNTNVLYTNQIVNQGASGGPVYICTNGMLAVKDKACFLIGIISGSDEGNNTKDKFRTSLVNNLFFDDIRMQAKLPFP